MNNDNDITFTLDTSSADDTITIDTSGFDSMMHGQSTFNIGSIDDDFDVSTLTFNDPIEFEDVLPSMSKISLMCNEYPALEKAFENFKTAYMIVKDDWNEENDDELPF